MSGWTIAWLVWGLLFAAIEAPAVLRRARGADTLSDHAWAFQRWTVRRVPVGRIVFAGFWIWLSAHLLAGC